MVAIPPHLAQAIQRRIDELKVPEGKRRWNGTRIGAGRMTDQTPEVRVRIPTPAWLHALDATRHDRAPGTTRTGCGASWGWRTRPAACARAGERATCRTRTDDRPITNRVLYQLS
jgi:hypothetical protein